MADASATQVRLCAACKASAARVVRARAVGTREIWEPPQVPTAADFGHPPMIAAPPIPAAIDQATFRCQACGATFEWRRRGCAQALLAAGLAAAFVLCVFGLLVQLGLFVSGRASPGAFVFMFLFTATIGALGFRSVWPWIVELRWPPQEAPLPPVTHPAPPWPTRRCACGQRSPCIALEQQVLRRSIPIGVAHVHRCPGCGRGFTVHDNLGCAFSGFAAAYLVAISVLIILHPPGGAAGAAESNRTFGYVLAVVAALAIAVFLSRIGGRLRHRVADP